MREVIKVFVSVLDIKVVGEAANGREAVAQYKQLHPDIVVMDWIMDEESGNEALQEIMAFDPDAYVIIISSLMGQDWLFQEAVLAGARQVFSKPIDKHKFVDYLRRLL
jgi:two-component system chemotaxis response regulator CheY